MGLGGLGGCVGLHIGGCGVSVAHDQEGGPGVCRGGIGSGGSIRGGLVRGQRQLLIEVQGGFADNGVVFVQCQGPDEGVIIIWTGIGSGQYEVREMVKGNGEEAGVLILGSTKALEQAD